MWGVETEMEMKLAFEVVRDTVLILVGIPALIGLAFLLPCWLAQ